MMLYSLSSNKNIFLLYPLMDCAAAREDNAVTSYLLDLRGLRSVNFADRFDYSRLLKFCTCSWFVQHSDMSATH